MLERKGEREKEKLRRKERAIYPLVTLIFAWNFQRNKEAPASKDEPILHGLARCSHAHAHPHQAKACREELVGGEGGN